MMRRTSSSRETAAVLSSSADGENAAAVGVAAVEPEKHTGDIKKKKNLLLSVISQEDSKQHL